MVSKIQNSIKIFVIYLLSISILGCQPNINNISQLPEQQANNIITATIKPTETHQTTSSPESKELLLSELMNTNGDCNNLCFWGIIQGQTPFQNAVDLMGNFVDTKLSNDQDGYQQFNHSIAFDDEKINISVMFSNIDGVVNNLEARVYGIGREDVSPNSWLAFRPDNFLLRNGKPNEINIAMSQGPEGRVSYGISFQYTNGYIIYDGNQIITLPEHVMNACPLEDQNLQSFLLVMSSEDKRILHENSFVPIDQVSSFSEDEVLKILLSGSPNACFDLDYDLYRAKTN